MEMRLSRRAFVRSTIGAGPLLLAACTPALPAPAAPTSAAQGTRGPIFPSYQPAVSRPTPDYPSAGPLYEDGYNNYPANPVRSVSQTPGSGGSVTAFVQPLQPPPTLLDQKLRCCVRRTQQLEGRRRRQVHQDVGDRRVPRGRRLRARGGRAGCVPPQLAHKYEHQTR